MGRGPKRVSDMKKHKLNFAAMLLLLCPAISLAAEFATYRLLSISETEKLILVSQIPGKAKFLLDAASAKITINGKPAEFRALKAYSQIQAKMNLRRVDKLGIEIDGAVTEIRVSTENKPD